MTFLFTVLFLTLFVNAALAQKLRQNQVYFLPDSLLKSTTAIQKLNNRVFGTLGDTSTIVQNPDSTLSVKGTVVPSMTEAQIDSITTYTSQTTFKAGTYTFVSNPTYTNSVVLESGAVFTNTPVFKGGFQADNSVHFTNGANLDSAKTPYVNPIWFNAKLDGTTDDLAAITSTKASIPHGGTILFTRGLIHTSSVVTFDSTLNVVLDEGAVFKDNVVFKGGVLASMSQHFQKGAGMDSVKSPAIYAIWFGEGSTGLQYAVNSSSIDATVAITSPINFTGTVTSPSNVFLDFTGSGSVNTPLGDTLDIKGSWKAPVDRQIFYGDGYVNVGGARIYEIYSAWYGDKGDGVTVDNVALTKATLAASGRQIVMRILPGTHILDSTFVLKSAFTGNRGAIFKMSAGFAPYTPAVVIGDSVVDAGGIYRQPVTQLFIDCNNVAHSIGLASSNVMENSTISNVVVSGFGLYGIYIHGTGAQNWDMNNLWVFSSNPNYDVTGAGIKISGVGSNNKIEKATIVAPKYMTAAIWARHSQVDLHNIHIEATSVAILADTNAIMNISDVYGASDSVVIKISAAAKYVAVSGVQPAPIAIYDGATGYSTGYGDVPPFYVHSADGIITTGPLTSYGNQSTFGEYFRLTNPGYGRISLRATNDVTYPGNTLYSTDDGATASRNLYIAGYQMNPISKLFLFVDTTYYSGGIRMAAGNYFNYGTVSGVNGYGFRDNAGTLEHKNSGGSWTTFGSGGGDALTSSPLSQFASTTSAQLAGVISNETGTNALVFQTSPSLYSPRADTLTTSNVIFPATEVPSSNANTLDDYEEGSYTATITCSTSGSYTLDAGANTLSYIKIGRKVFVTGYLSITSASSPSGTLQISLPFANSAGTAYSTSAYGVAVLRDAGTIAGKLYIAIAVSSSTMGIMEVNDDGTMTSISNTNVDTAWSLGISVMYTAAD